jgi:ABC-type branched-subunit amino acid transport system substrate-binding protein
MDTGHSYSLALGQAFMKQIHDDFDSGRTNKQCEKIDFTDQDTAAKVGAYASSVKVAPDLIYFAGNAEQAHTFLVALPSAWKQKSGPRVLGGDALYQPGKYNATDYSLLSFTSFAYPDATGTFASPLFLGSEGAYAAIFDPTHQHAGAYGYNRPDAATILAYDAMGVVIQAVNQSQMTASVTPDTLLNALRAIKKANFYAGITGKISFDTDGNPLPGTRTVLLLREFFVPKQGNKAEGAVAKQEYFS